MTLKSEMAAYIGPDGLVQPQAGVESMVLAPI
jgi:hypothetical protein